MDGERGYVVPCYRAPEGAAWYHFLHGNVPGHQIDFIYRPEVPQKPLLPIHFSHLSRLMKYIEPPASFAFAFAVGNLSRDDTQHEPGHGGLALIFMLRVHGVTDHAGRQDPPLSHGIAAIDRSLDEATLLASSVAFQRHVLDAAESEEWYRAYVRSAQEDPGSTVATIERYVSHFCDLPQPDASAMTPAWTANGAQQPRRIVISHDDDASFSDLAAAAARIGAMLYRSDIRWTVISNGREDDVPNGVSVRFVARSDFGPADTAAVVHALADLPADEAGIAALLFGATRVMTEEEQAAQDARERYSSVERPVRPSSWGGPAPRRPSDPALTVDVDVDVETAGAPVATAAAVRDSAPTVVASSPQLRERLLAGQPAMRSDPPPPDRAAMIEVKLPVAPTLPMIVAPEAPPASVPVPSQGAGDGRSSKTLWWIIGGVCAVSAAVVAFLAGQSSRVDPPPPARNSAGATALPPPSTSATPSAAPTASSAPTASVGVAPLMSIAPAASAAPAMGTTGPRPKGPEKPPGNGRRQILAPDRPATTSTAPQPLFEREK